jgi:hypothetical protein
VTVPPLGVLVARSAGSVLHSQVGSGKDGAFALRARFFAVRLQGSLRTAPAPLGVFGGSAGSVLRSQGTLGPAELSRYRARGIRMSTFLCSLRPEPAAASWRRRKPLEKVRRSGCPNGALHTSPG